MTSETGQLAFPLSGIGDKGQTVDSFFFPLFPPGSFGRLPFSYFVRGRGPLGASLTHFLSSGAIVWPR